MWLTFNLVTPLPYCLLHTFAVSLSYSQYQHTDLSQPTADYQRLLNVDCLTTAFCFVASFEQAGFCVVFANYMPPLLTWNYNKKSKDKSAPLSTWKFLPRWALGITWNS
jgi:hypothetical protein